MSLSAAQVKEALTLLQPFPQSLEAYQQVIATTEGAELHPENIVKIMVTEAHLERLAALHEAIQKHVGTDPVIIL